jgi:hypothetical protein
MAEVRWFWLAVCSEGCGGGVEMSGEMGVVVGGSRVVEGDVENGAGGLISEKALGVEVESCRDGGGVVLDVEARLMVRGFFVLTKRPFAFRGCWALRFLSAGVFCVVSSFRELSPGDEDRWRLRIMDVVELSDGRAVYWLKRVTRLWRRQTKYMNLSVTKMFVRIHCFTFRSFRASLCHGESVDAMRVRC